jgi:hypothetical protein
VMVSSLSSGSDVIDLLLFTGSPDRVSPLSRPGTRPGIRPVIHNRQLEGWRSGRGFPLPFGHRHSLLGHPSPAKESSPPHGRLAGPEVRTLTGFPRSAHTSCDRGGRPLCPGDDGAHPGRGHSTAGVGRFAAASPCTPPYIPSTRISVNEASTKGSRMFARPIFPSPAAARMERAALRLSLGFAPRRPGAGQRTPG